MTVKIVKPEGKLLCSNSERHYVNMRKQIPGEYAQTLHKKHRGDSNDGFDLRKFEASKNKSLLI